MVIQPIETIIIDGFVQRFSKVFNCKNTLLSNAYEKMRILKDRNAGNSLSFPMAFITVSSIAASPDRYSSPYLARTGLPIVDTDTSSTLAVKVIPAMLQLEIEFRSNELDMSREHSILAFSKKWIFARRNGQLKFNVRYGKNSFQIGSILDEQVSVPTRSSATEQVPEYLTTVGMQLQGWVSESNTKHIGKISEIDVSAKLTSEFWKFPNSGDSI